MSLFEQIELKIFTFWRKINCSRKFLSAGFPTKKDEEYKYTHLKEITEKDYNFSPSEHHSITKNN
jgi:Fe-S cluster assembly protein SufD